MSRPMGIASPSRSARLHLLNRGRPLEVDPGDGEGGELVSNEIRELATVEHDRPGARIVKARDIAKPL